MTLRKGVRRILCEFCFSLGLPKEGCRDEICEKAQLELYKRNLRVFTERGFSEEPWPEVEDE